MCDEELNIILTPTGGDVRSGILDTMVDGTKVGDVLRVMQTSVDGLLERTARVARQVLRNAELDPDSIRGVLSFMCCLNVMTSGHAGMTKLAEKLAAAVGYTPTLGMCVGPETGQRS